MNDKHFGGYDGPPKTIAEALERAGEQDLRRQQQIERQKAIINRLLDENQLMLNFVESIPQTGKRFIAIRKTAKDIADQVGLMRREAEQDGKDHQTDDS